MKDRQILLCGLVFIFFSLKGIAMNNVEENKCSMKLKYYEKIYLSDTGRGKYSFNKRLDYLAGLKTTCSDSDYAIFYKANILFEMAKHQEAITEINRGLKLHPERQGNLLLSKVTYLYILKSSGAPVKESYQELIELLKLALKSGNENPHMVHLQWAEIAIELGNKSGDYNEAVEHVIAGNDIKTVYRFYTLLAIIAEKTGEYEKAVSFIMDAIKSEGGMRYLHEADTVLSLTKSLCALREREQAIKVVESAIKISDIQRNNPLIKQAAKLVLENCL